MRLPPESLPIFWKALSTGLALFFVLWAVLPLCTAVASGADPDRFGARATEITAASMQYSHQNTTVVFTGDVQVLRKDFRLWCRKLTVHLRQEAAESLKAEGDKTAASQAPDDLSRQFEKIVAEQDVRLQMNDREATGQRAVYESSSNTLTLQGDVVLTEGQNTIQGETVTFYMDENRTEIAGGERKRVKALFFPSEESESGDGISSSGQSE